MMITMKTMKNVIQTAKEVKKEGGFVTTPKRAKNVREMTRTKGSAIKSVKMKMRTDHGLNGPIARSRVDKVNVVEVKNAIQKIRRRAGTERCGRSRRRATWGSAACQDQNPATAHLTAKKTTTVTTWEAPITMTTVQTTLTMTMTSLKGIMTSLKASTFPN